MSRQQAKKKLVKLKTCIREAWELTPRDILLPIITKANGNRVPSIRDGKIADAVVKRIMKALPKEREHTSYCYTAYGYSCSCGVSDFNKCRQEFLRTLRSGK